MSTELSKEEGVKIKELVAKAAASTEAQELVEADSEKTTTLGSRSFSAYGLTRILNFTMKQLSKL